MRQEMEMNGQGLPQAVCAITRKRVRETRKPSGPFSLLVYFAWKKQGGEGGQNTWEGMTNCADLRAGGKRGGCGSW